MNTEKALTLIVAKLSEIADRLADLSTDGFVTSGSINVTTETTEIVGAVSSITLINDGDSDVFLWTKEPESRKPWVMRDAPLKKGEKLDINFKSRQGGIIRLRCQSGTATVRYWRNV